MVIILVVVLSILAIYLATRITLTRPQFGSLATGARCDRINASPNFREGQFQNQSNTPSLTEGASYPRILYEFIFANKKNRKPPAPIPSVKSDLLSLTRDEDLLVWFGHSSYFLQLDGMRYLVDAVLSGHASPFSFTTKSFPGSNNYSVQDLPPVDVLIITHDHYDHLDYETVTKLRSKVKHVVTGLGTGAHLEKWEFNPDIITELDWNESFQPTKETTLLALPARHFSGRGLKRNTSLWVSFALTTPNWKIYIGGDSGYDKHFREIGESHGPFDLVILENGQYNKSWKYIHMMPEEVVEAAIDLKADMLLPVHWGKFSLSTHDWDEPIKRVTAAAQAKQVRTLHPRIGEIQLLRNPQPSTRWWEALTRT